MLAALLIGLYFLSSHEHRPRPIRHHEIESSNPEFETLIRAELDEQSDQFAVYFFNLQKDDQPSVFQSRPMRPASMIKVFVMAKAMFEVKQGNLSLDEPIIMTEENIVGGAGSIAGEGAGAQVPVRKLIELMIIESDNTATNMLMDRLGMEDLNKYLRDNGYRDTIINHKMMLDEGKMTNLSSVLDLGTLFTRIYRHECVDDYYDRLMVDYLLRQEDTDCFPSALPYWNIAHKTGEVTGLYDDGGIFYGSAYDFVLVIMNDGIDGREETIDRMKAITRKVAMIAER